MSPLGWTKAKDNNARGYSFPLQTELTHSFQQLGTIFLVLIGINQFWLHVNQTKALCFSYLAFVFLYETIFYHNMYRPHDLSSFSLVLSTDIIGLKQTSVFCPKTLSDLRGRLYTEHFTKTEVLNLRVMTHSGVVITYLHYDS